MVRHPPSQLTSKRCQHENLHQPEAESNRTGNCPGNMPIPFIEQQGRSPMSAKRLRFDEGNPLLYDHEHNDSGDIATDMSWPDDQGSVLVSFSY
jgi:hypothetical protein